MSFCILPVLCLSVAMAGAVVVEPAGMVSEQYISSTSSSSQEVLDQYLILSAEFPEDLELILENGYPTPEIQELLSSESIPEEDRYWLDCRIRSRIAQVLNRFYDENGNIVNVEAEWVSPGEDYWREIMMVYSPEEQPNAVSELNPHSNGKSCFLYDLYGTTVGQLAVASKDVKLSRDASIGVVQTGYRSRVPNYHGNDMYFCFLYPDGTFREVEIEESYLFSDFSQAVSQDGSISAWNLYNGHDYSESYLLIYDKFGNRIEQTEVPSDIDCISISPNSEYVAYTTGQRDQSSGLLIRDIQELITIATGWGRPPVFSSNSRFCTFPDGYIYAYSSIVNLHTLEQQTVSNERSFLPGTNGASTICVSNSGSIVAMGNQVYNCGEPIFSNNRYRSNAISPNGYFVILYGDSRRGIRVNNNQFALYCTDKTVAD